MNPLSNAHWLVVDPTVNLFERDRWVDLLAPNVPTVGQGKYVCWQYDVPKGQVLVVKGVAPYALARTNPGSDEESKQMITPEDGNNFFFFEPRVNDSAVGVIVADAVRDREAPAAGLNDLDRATAAGWTSISLEPRKDAHIQWANPLYGFIVPSGATLKIIFSIIPPARDNPFPTDGQYTIGDDATKRVDYAGACVVGHQLPQQLYDRIADEIRQGRA